MKATGSCKRCGCREALLTEKDAAELLATSPNTLNDWRTTRRQTLPYVKLGRSVRYCPGCLREWLDQQTVAV